MKSFHSKVMVVLSLMIVAFLVVSCNSFKKTTVVSVAQPGSANFSTYVSLGNSLTAGYQNGALYQSSQEYSYPADIAKEAGVTDFEQPLISDPGIGGRMKITGFTALGVNIGYDPVAGGSPLNAALARPYNNLGVPGAVLGDLLYTTDFAAQANPAGRNNPFFQIVLRSSALGSNMVDQALALHPTFISVWIGANDVLGYATSGGTKGTDQTGTLPTDVNFFGAVYTQTMDSLLAGAPNAKFVVANIPDVSAIPFFTTIPPVVVDPTTGSALIVGGQPVPLIVMRHDAHGNLYAGPANIYYDKILLPAITAEEQGIGIPGQGPNGTTVPLPDSLVLDSLEVSRVEAATAGYNAAILSVANSNPSRIALVDAYTALNNLAANGYTDPATGVHLTSAYVTGGFFGLDGVHPTSMGYAYIANTFIDAINAKFGAKLSHVDLNTIPGSIPLAKYSSRRSVWPIISSENWHRILSLFQATEVR